MLDATKLASIRVPLPGGADVTLPLFKRPGTKGAAPQFTRSCVVYGKNGTGKSTISRTLRTEPRKAEFLDLSDAPIEVDFEDAERANIFVYDEDYVRETFLELDLPHLPPIVLLGQAAETMREEERLSRVLDAATKTRDGLEAALNAKERAREELKEELGDRVRGKTETSKGSWKKRSKGYRPDGQHAYVTDSVISNVKGRASKLGPGSKMGDHLEAEFEALVSKIRVAQDQERVSWERPALTVPVDTQRIARCFETVASSANEASLSLSELEQRVADAGVGASVLKERLSSVFGGTGAFCPTCFQDISADFSNLARAAIQKYLDELAQNEALQNLAQLEITWRPAVKLPTEAFEDNGARECVRAATDLLISQIEGINESIRRKVDRPQEVVPLDPAPFQDALEELDRALAELERAVTEHNRNFADVETLRLKAKTLNTKIASYEVLDIVQKMTKADSELASTKAEWEKADAEVASRAETLEELRETRRSSKRAAVEVNKLLHIAYGEGGLRLHATGEGYLVVNRSRDVAPRHLSTGERNVLSLCYYIVEVANGREYERAFSSNQLLLLDDPISSFDQDNKYGVTALLLWLASQCAKKKSETKLAVFTHDLSVAYELSKGFKGANNNNLELTLTFGAAKMDNFEHHDYYSEYLARMLEFATAEASAGALPRIDPNNTRKVWEAFATFELGDNPTNAITSKKVRSYFEALGTNHQAFLEAYPGRVFIHADSHSETNVRYWDFHLQPALRPEDNQRFVREILCFMHVVSPLHIASRLGRNLDKAREINAQLDRLVATVLNAAEAEMSTTAP